MMLGMIEEKLARALPTAHPCLHSNRKRVDNLRQCKYHLLVMPLTRFLQNTAFGPEEIALLVAAYKAALHELDQARQKPGDPAAQEH